MSSGSTVAKAIWTDADFDAMNWHDAAVHAIALEPAPPYPGRLLVDLDYVVERVPSGALVCPATLVFGQARELAADINLPGPSFEPSLDAIRRSGPDQDDAFVWTLVGHLFSIGLRATGFTQYLRRAPVRSPRPRLTADERGGLSFDQRGYADSPGRPADAGG
jgi:fermentation-respiration switch protein FrsA (DUF1100 family)